VRGLSCADGCDVWPCFYVDVSHHPLLLRVKTMRTDDEELQELLDFLDKHERHGINRVPDTVEFDSIVDITSRCSCGETMHVICDRQNLDEFFFRIVKEFASGQRRPRPRA
jgi:hypothetical protein